METPVNEVYATDLLKIKRCMLLSLIRETLYPEDAVKRKEVLSKYEPFTMPEEEADWHGLPLHEAHDKQFLLEKLYKEWASRPKKEEYRQELVGMLRQGYLQDIDPSILYEDGKEPRTVSQTIESVSSSTSKAFKSIKDKFNK